MWLAEQLSEDVPMLVGIDRGFSFPLRYFQEFELPLNWRAFLADFHRHWPTDEDIFVDFVREAVCGNGGARWGNPNWRRVTEVRARGAKSVFHFDVQGSVAKSTHNGLPWLRYLDQRLGKRVHFWPFDGWQAPPGRSVIAEVYPALWNKTFLSEDRDGHQQDAYAIAAWMHRAHTDGSLAIYTNPPLQEKERKIAEIEGWILGAL
jgi:hypothetical protein